MGKAPGEQLLTKLVETIAAGVGAIAEPWQIRRTARASAEALLLDGKARADSIAYERRLLDQVERELQSRANASQAAITSQPTGSPAVNVRGVALEAISLDGSSERVEPLIQYIGADVLMREAQRHLNLERTLLHAEQFAESDATDNVSENRVDPDWFTQWRSAAENISNTDMQTLWARILLGEVKSPGMFSLRVVDFVRKLSKSEAVIIEKIAKYKLDDHIYFDKALRVSSLKKYSDDLFALKELGVIESDHPVKSLTRSIGIESYSFWPASGGVIIGENNSNEVLSVRYDAIRFTSLGISLLRLVNSPIDWEYIGYFSEILSESGLDVYFSSTYRISADGACEYENPTQLALSKLKRKR